MTICTFFLGSGSACAAIPIEGDAGLLQLVLDAQATNSARHRHGAMTARVTERGAEDIDLEVEFVWDGDRRYWRYSGRATARATSSVSEFRDIEMIVLPDAQMVYSPTERRAVHTTHLRSIGAYRETLKLHPDDIWYSVGRFPRTWQQLLDPQASTIGRVIVRRDGEGHVVIERHGQGERWTRATASLVQGGNIVAYETDTNRATEYGDHARRGRYEWAPDGNGGWYPKEIIHEQYNADDLETPFWTFHLEVLSFDPRPQFPPDRFDFESFPIAEGTSISYRDATGDTKRQWVHGGKRDTAGTVSQDVLDTLGEKLRQEGFANPARRQP